MGNRTSEEGMEAFMLRLDEKFNAFLKLMGIDKTIDEVVADSEAVSVVPIEENKAVLIVPKEDNVFGAPGEDDNALLGWRGINKTIQEVMVEEVKGDSALSTPVNKIDFYGYDSLAMKNPVYPNFSGNEDNHVWEKNPCGNYFSTKVKNSVHDPAKDFNVAFSPVIKKDECLGTNCRKLDGNEFSHCHPTIVGVEETVILDKDTRKNGEIIELGCNGMPKNWRDSEFQNEIYTHSLDSYGCELNMNNTERASENVVKEKKRKDNYIAVKGLVSFYGLRYHEFLEEFDELKLSVVITKFLKGWAEVVTRFRGGGSVISIGKEQTSGVNSLASNYEKANWVTDPGEQASGKMSERDGKWTSKVVDKSFILQGAGNSMRKRGMTIVRFYLCPNHPLVQEFVQFFYSVGTGGGPPPPPPAEKPVTVEPRSDFAKAGSATVMHMQFPGKKPEFGLVETKPSVAARMGYWGRDKTASTYDLVEQMHFLYVHVVKAKDLPVMDITGSLDPYVEVKVGNYKGVTNHLGKNQNPFWNRVFAFSRERLQSKLIEVTVKDKDFAKDDFVGKAVFDVVDVPLRVPPDSPLAPQWYRLEDKKGQKIHNLGEVMLAVWMGTQADEAFPELDDKLELWWCYNKQKMIATIMENFKNIGKSWVEKVTGFRGGTIFGRNYLAKLMLPVQQMEKLWRSLEVKPKLLCVIVLKIQSVRILTENLRKWFIAFERCIIAK